MTWRPVLTGLLIFAAFLGEMALPIWLGSIPILPSLLDLALLGICLTLTGGEAVFWGGLIGLLADDFSGGPAGQGIVIGATLVWWSQGLGKLFSPARSGLDHALFTCLIVLTLGLFRLGAALWNGETLPFDNLVSLIAGRMAATLLVLLLIQGVSAVQGARRSEWKFGG